MRRGRGQKTRRGPRHGSFNPYDTNTIKHTRLGVWDLYEQVDPGIVRLPGVSEVARRLEVLNDLPYVWRMLKDVASIKSCWLYFLIYCVVELLSSLLPAATLWFVLDPSTSQTMRSRPPQVFGTIFVHCTLLPYSVQGLSHVEFYSRSKLPSSAGPLTESYCSMLLLVVWAVPSLAMLSVISNPAWSFRWT